MVERGERMRLAAPKLRDERKNRRGIRSLAIEAAQYHSDVLSESAREASSREEIYWVGVVFRRLATHDLFESDREFIRIEGAAGADLRARLDDFIPRLH